MILRYLTPIFFGILLSYHAYGQAGYRQRKNNRSEQKPFPSEISRYSVGLQTGLTQFYGELNNQDMKGMVGVHLSRNLSRIFAMGLYYTAGKLGGEKEPFFNSYFLNEYNSFELSAKWSLSEQFRKKRQKPGPFDVAVYAGIGLMIFNSNAFDLKTNALVRFSNSEKSARNPLFLRWGTPKGPAGIRKTREGILPIGLSMHYEILEQWQVGVDARFYFIRTDKADATSGRRLVNPEESSSYSDTPNDKFSLLSFSVIHRLGKTQ
jgi:hypothetical protein